MLWCQKKDTNDHDCLLLGTVYIPPEGSKYANDDNIEDICQDLIDLSNNLPICLMGDYNSRTGTLSDIEEFDWITQCVPNINQFKNFVKEGIHTKYKDLWTSDVFTNSKCYNSRIFEKN